MNPDDWLRSVGLPQYAEQFRTHAIDAELLPRLTGDDLKDIGVTAVGHRKRLLEAIALLASPPAGATAEAATAATGPAPDQYTPSGLASKIRLAQATLEGERKQVTVLFADLKGSMELLAERDPEEARVILDPVLERMMEAVHHVEGTVNQVMGDGIMALFGAPIAHEDHAVRACHAALRMQASLQRHADDVRRLHGVEVQIRVGLNSGEVVVRGVGSDLRMDYTAVGQTTHLAARMEQLAPPGTVRMTGATVRLAAGLIEVRPLGLVPVKGLADPIEIFELLGQGPVRTRLQASALRGLTAFVGREAELGHVHRVLAQAGAGRGQVVAIVGEAGVGKSRLVHEFTHAERVRDWQVLGGSSMSYGKATSYLPVVGLLKSHFRIDGRDDHRIIRDKVLGSLTALDTALEPLLTPLLALLDMPVDDPEWTPLDPPRRRRRTIDALRQLLLRLSVARPLLLVFEDLHWVDAETQAVIDSLVDSIGSARVLLLVNYRPGYEHRWGSKTVYSQLRLDSLAIDSATELLASYLGPDPSVKPLERMLVKRGNPFFLEETLRTLVEAGSLVGRRGAYRLVRPVETLQVPDTVQTVLAARIDRLPVDVKQLLQAASAIGKDFPFALLTAIAEVPEDAARGGLDRLKDAEFVYETRQYPEPEYTFKHALTHDVTYASMLGDRRRALHARIVWALECLHADRLTEHVERLAQHAQRGQLWEQAVRYGRQAGRRALDLSAPSAALEAFERARVALRELPETRERTELLIDLSLEQRDAHFRMGELQRLGEVLGEASALAEGLGDQRRLAETLALQASSRTFLGEHSAAIEAAESACEAADDAGELSLRCFSAFILGQALWFAGESRRALMPLQAALGLLRDVPISTRMGRPPMLAGVFARFHLASALAIVGRFAEAIAIGEEAMRIATAEADPYSEIFARFGLAAGHRTLGEFSEAVRVMEPALALCTALENRFLLAHTMALLGPAYLRCGRAAEAATMLEQALSAFKAMQIRGMVPFNMSLLAEVYLDQGRIDDARELAEQALALARTQHEQGWQAWCLKTLGDVRALELEDPEPARSAYHQALTMATELTLCPLAAHCHLGLGKLASRSGQREAAKEHLGAAVTLYRDMGMSYWLGGAESELQSLD